MISDQCDLELNEKINIHCLVFQLSLLVSMGPQNYCGLQKIVKLGAVLNRMLYFQPLTTANLHLEVLQQSLILRTKSS